MAKKKIEVINKTYLSLSDARTLWNYNHTEDNSNLVVDFSLFYTDHCKVHPIDLLFDYIKKAAKESDDPICYFYENFVFQNLDYEEKKIKKSEDRPNNFWQKLFHKTTHYEWEETDWDHLRHYHIMADNIMHELWIYLLKAGWRVEYYKDPDNELRKFFKICF
jgi:hypothetical protein